MSVNLVTGYAGKAHVTAEAEGACTAGMFGAGKYVLNVGDVFAYEIISNNLIRVKSGYALDQGRKIELAVDDYEEVEIDNGLQGVKRVDIIALRYEKDVNTGIENTSMIVVKGTSGDEYTDPDLAEGDILSGDFVDEMPLYRVKINGINIEAVEEMFTLRESEVEYTKLRTYSSLEDIGMTTNNTLNEVMAAMQRKSVLMMATSAGASLPFNQELPNTSTGMLTIEKSATNGRGKAVYSKLQTGETWINEWYNNAFIGWKKVAYVEDIPVIQSGVYEVSVTSTTKTDHTINFDTQFENVPNVQISEGFSKVMTESKPYAVHMLIKSVSKSKMVVTVWSDGTSTPFTIHWTAIL